MTNFSLHKRIGILKLVNFLQQKQVCYLLFAFVKSYVDYGALTWRGTAKTHIS